MPEPSSHRYLAALEPLRDRLYSLALALAGSEDAAERLLQKALRLSYRQFAESPPRGDLWAWIHRGVLEQAPPQPEALNEPATLTAMPAATWARLAAAIQIEAAALGGSSAINPESVLLVPDPLLVPKPRSPRRRDHEAIHERPLPRFMLMVLVALAIGIALTVVILRYRHPAPATTEPARTPPAAVPETAPAPAASAPATQEK